MMPTLTIRNLDPEVRDEIRIHAAKNGRSMEAEVRDILSAFVRQHKSTPKQIASRIQKRFARIGGADELDLPARERASEPATFKE